MRGLSISRWMLRSWLQMLYSKNIGIHQLEVFSIHSKDGDMYVEPLINLFKRS